MSSLLIDFKAIVNTDISILNIVKEKFNKIVNEKHPPLNYELVMGRYNPNPLEIISNPELKCDKLDKIYDSIIEEEYENILKDKDIIISNSILEYANILKDMEDMNIYIRCDNELESKYIKDNFPEYKCIIEEFNNNYDLYIIKIFNHEIIDILSNKKIYCIDYNFNNILLNIYTAFYGEKIKNDINLIKSLNLKVRG